MTDIAIRIEQLSKAYRIWAHPSDMLKEAVTGRKRHTDFQALKDISLEVPRGSILGILGRNGAGKSTLLRIIAGTLDATSGSVTVNGRVAAILELGTGFHLDYTGRENIRLGGMCLGLSAAEIAAREQEIIDFAELAEFIDRPFRTYSSGMQARLTFAVATSVNPDILIIDEALSVGDIRFQRKSYARIEAFAKAGVTILFVTQDTQTIAQLADAALVLDAGGVYFYGDPGRAISRYTRLMFGAGDQNGFWAIAASNGPKSNDQEDAAQSPNANAEVPGGPATKEDAPPEADPVRYGSKAAIIEDAWIENHSQERVESLPFGEDFSVCMKVFANYDLRDCSFGFRVVTVEGKDIYGTNSILKNRTDLSMRAGERYVVRFSSRGILAPGWYFVTLGVADTSDSIFDRRIDQLRMRVFGKFDGYSSSLVDLEARFEIAGSA